MLETGFVYFIVAARSNLVKIGWSLTPMMRVEALQTGSPEPLALLRTVPGSVRLEKRLHAEYAPLRSHGEWFRLEGALARDIADGRQYDPHFSKRPPVRKKGSPRLWQHKNGMYYVLYGPRLAHRISTKSKNAATAQAFLASFSAAA